MTADTAVDLRKHATKASLASEGLCPGNSSALMILPDLPMGCPTWTKQGGTHFHPSPCPCLLEKHAVELGFSCQFPDPVLMLVISELYPPLSRFS